MAVTIENTAPCHKKLRVEVNAGRVAGTRAEILQEFRKFAAIPGFRPGKAPEPMVEKRYAGQIDEELRKRLIPESYRGCRVQARQRTGLHRRCRHRAGICAAGLQGDPREEESRHGEGRGDHQDH